MSDSLGNTLKQARRRLGLRVKDVASRTTARISASYLSCIENDLRLPSEQLLLELADLLGLDRRELYLELVRAKAPADLAGLLFATATPVDPGYAAARKLTLEELVARATRPGPEACASEAAPAGSTNAARRWETDSARYRMQIEKTSVEATISLDGTATILRHVFGLEPRPGRPALVSLQHTARVPPGGEAADDGFKLLEQPGDVPVDLERHAIGPDQRILRVVFPEGLVHEPGKDRRISYVFRSVLLGAFSLARPPRERSRDALGDDRGDRAAVVVAVDKPSRELEVEVRFPRFYVPHELGAWAGTQEIYETDDNFIDQEVAEVWSFEAREDFRARLRVVRPQIGMKFGIVWSPLYEEELRRVRERLEMEIEENRT